MRAPLHKDTKAESKMKMNIIPSHKEQPTTTAVDISEIAYGAGPYICPNCDVVMVAKKIEDHKEYKCPICGTEQNPITDSMKHASKLAPAITEEMITEADDPSLFALLDEEEDELPKPKEADNEILDQDIKQDDMWRRKGYKVKIIDSG